VLTALVVQAVEEEAVVVVVQLSLRVQMVVQQVGLETVEQVVGLVVPLLQLLDHLPQQSLR
jgi:hypothetical protein